MGSGIRLEPSWPARWGQAGNAPEALNPAQTSRTSWSWRVVSPLGRRRRPRCPEGSCRVSVLADAAQDPRPSRSPFRVTPVLLCRAQGPESVHRPPRWGGFEPAPKAFGGGSREFAGRGAGTVELRWDGCHPRKRKTVWGSGKCVRPARAVTRVAASRRTPSKRVGRWVRSAEFGFERC